MKLTISDVELCQELERGKTQVEIAAEHGVTPECIAERLRSLRKLAVAPAARRAREVVDFTLTAAEQLSSNLDILRSLQEACLRELRSDVHAVDLGVRAAEVTVSIPSSEVGKPPERVPLLKLLSDLGVEYQAVESKQADPRALLLQVVEQLRRHTEFALRMMDRIYHAQEIERFQQDILDAIAGVDEQTAARIRGAIHQRRSLRLALEPPRPPNG